MIFQPKTTVAADLLKKFNEIEEKRSVVQELEYNLKEAIFNLRTYKKLEDDFPEAFLLIPKKENCSLQTNLSDIRKKLNSKE